MFERRRRTFRHGTRSGAAPAAASAARAARLAAALLAPLLLWPAAAIAAAPARLDRTDFPAAGRSLATLEVAEFGRYAIAVESRSGVALQVVDRMAGAGELAGAAGERDGRIDLFLDRGPVRVVLHGAERARGRAQLAARPFVERNLVEGEPPRLVELKPVATDLGDLEQRSYWIELARRTTVVVEAAGRHLADLRLWRSGSWLEPAAPVVTGIEPERGRPLTLCQLAADLEPGLYLLTAYGGAGLAWSAEGGGERPLHLRWGVERRGAAGRRFGRVGPLGFDRFLVPATADYFRLELPEAKPFALEVAPYEPSDPLAALARRQDPSAAGIAKESVPPVAELRPGRGAPDEIRLVTVRGAPGEPYVVQQFAAAKKIPIPAPGDFWVGSLNAGAAGDAIDATGVLVAWPKEGDRRPRFEAASALRLDRATAWARRFNLLDPATLHLEVVDAGSFELTSRGVPVEVRIEPFLVSPPRGHQPPPFRAAPASFELAPGLYVATLRPLAPGIVELGIRRHGLLDPLVAALETLSGGAPAERTASAAQPAVTLGRRAFAPRTDYELWLNDQPGVETGGLLRPLPLDLGDPLPVALAPGETLELPARTAERGTIVATGERGERLELSADGVGWARELALAPGDHLVRVRRSGAESALASVAFLPESRAASSPLPPLSAAARAQLPAFPRLDPGAPHALDLGERQAASFEIDAAEAGLYVIESTGLLATEGALRTRVVPELVAARENGIGRNAALRAYLREGRYQATFRTRGASAGHLGVELRRAALADGGELSLGLAARAELPPEGALAYRFAIARAGVFRLRSFGLAGPLDGRLEDADGWPVDAPVASGERTLRLEPGRYRWIVLPRAVAFRAVTRIDELPEPVELSGHGPHLLPLGAARENLWLEPDAGAPRLPDRWRFALPAPTCVAIELGGEMQGEIVRETGGARAVVSAVRPGRSWRCGLAAGDYTLEAVHSRVNSRVRYAVSIEPSALVDGLERRIELPAVVPVALGGEGAIEIESFGAADVRARLFDARGRLVAAADDRPGDWNFLLAERLAGGTYRLEVERSGGAGGETAVALRVRREREAGLLPLPAAAHLALGEEIAVVPLELPDGAEVVALGAAGAGGARTVGLALEERLASGWATVTSAADAAPLLLVPLDPTSKRPLRARLVSLDRHPVSVRLTGYAGPLARASEEQLAAGLALAPLPRVEPPLAAVAVRLGASGCFALDAGEAAILHAHRPLRPFAPAAATLVAPEPALWLAARSRGGAAPRVAARRLFLAEGEPAALVLPPGERVTCDVAPGEGPLAATVAAQAGDPWIRFAGASGERIDRATAFDRRRALALAPLAGEPRVELGHGEARPLEVQVAIARLARLDARAALAEFEAEIAPRSAQPLFLVPGPRLSRITLAPGTAALVGAPPDAAGPRETVLWAAEREATFALRDATRVELANLGDLPARARIESFLDAGEPAPPGGALLVESRLDRRVRLRVELPASDAAASGERELRVRGAHAAAVVGADGALARGEPLALPRRGGTLLLDAGPGFVGVWIEEPESDLRRLGFELGDLAAALELPARPALAGREASFGLALAAPALLTVRGAEPAAVGLGFGGERRFELFPGAVALDALLPAGRALLSFRALAGGALAGAVEIAALPLAPLAEGLGEPTLLAPGEARGYRFEVERAGPVGVGVAAAERGVETVVFDLAGRRLGRGVVQWLDLEPGGYALAVVAAPDAAPGLVRPALVGAAPPGTGPPSEVVRSFLALARAAAPVATGVAGRIAPPRFRPAAAVPAPEASDARAPCSDDQGNPCAEEPAGDEGEFE